MTTQSAARRGKYGNKRTELDGIVFASAAEAKRYSELKLLERAGEISGLELQPRYQLVVKGHKVCTYVGDFRYLDKTGAPVTEDVKGVATDAFKIKARLFRALMGRDIQIIKRSR